MTAEQQLAAAKARGLRLLYTRTIAPVQNGMCAHCEQTTTQGHLTRDECVTALKGALAGHTGGTPSHPVLGVCLEPCGGWCCR